MISLNSALG